MIEVIKQGALPEFLIHTAECYNCKTEYEFTQNDAKLINVRLLGPKFVTTCPLCQKQVISDTDSGRPPETTEPRVYRY